MQSPIELQRRIEVATYERKMSAEALARGSVNWPFLNALSLKLPSFVAGAVFLLHVAAVALYLGPPESLLRQRFGVAVVGYIEPLFTQNWHLFSPNPGITSYRTLVKCHFTEGESDWLDPMAPAREAFTVNRLNGVGKILNIHSAMAGEVMTFVTEKAKGCNCSIEEASRRYASEARSFGHLMRFGHKVCLDRGTAYTAVDVRIAVLSPVPYSARNDIHEPWGKVEVYDFRDK